MNSYKEMQDVSRKLRDAAGRAYIAQRNGQYRRIEARETESEIREAIRGMVAR